MNQRRNEEILPISPGSKTLMSLAGGHEQRPSLGGLRGDGGVPLSALQLTTTCLLQNLQAASGLLERSLMSCGQVR